MVFLLAAGPLWAGEGAVLCAEEATGPGRAACLGLVADQGVMAMETYLAGITTSIQGARPAQITGFERGLTASQADWRRKAERECRRQPVGVARQSCRVAEVRAREVALVEIVGRAFAPLGGVPGGVPFATDGVEILVPLDGRGTPRPFLRLGTPLTPLTP